MVSFHMIWTVADVEYLRATYSKDTIAEIATRLGCSHKAVISKHYKLGIESSIPRWTEADLDVLRAAYANRGGTVSIDELSARLGRLKSNVCRKARELGLTTRQRKHANAPGAMSARMKQWHATHEHPRGATGMTHTPEAKAKQAAASRRMWANPACPLNSDEHRQRMSDRNVALHAAGRMRSGYSRCAGGKRADLGDLYFRSSWEANYARYLNLLVRAGKIASWDFEPHTFIFEAIKRGTRSYLPDFKVMKRDGSHEWHEVKGWMDAKSKTKLARMAKYFPDERVIVVGAAWFKSANKSIAPLIPTWERKPQRRAA